jgi:hypothetical protein
LQPAATAAKLTVRQSDWMTAKNAPPPFNHAGLSAALFSPESIKSRQNTEAIEVQRGTLVAARVAEHRPARLRPLAEVSAAIEARLRAARSKQLLAKKGEATIAALAKGNEAGLSWSGFQVVSRQPSAELDAAGVKAVFRVNADKLPAYTGFARADGSYRIVRVSRVLAAPELDPMLLTSIESGVMQAQQRADMEAMVALITALYTAPPAMAAAALPMVVPSFSMLRLEDSAWRPVSATAPSICFSSPIACCRSARMRIASSRFLPARAMGCGHSRGDVPPCSRAQGKMYFGRGKNRKTARRRLRWSSRAAIP